VLSIITVPRATTGREFFVISWLHKYVFYKYNRDTYIHLTKLLFTSGFADLLNGSVLNTIVNATLLIQFLVDL